MQRQRHPAGSKTPSRGPPRVLVGGDRYDVLPLDDGSVVIPLGDVMGKGVPAVIVMSEVGSALRAYALLDARPSVVLAASTG